MCIHDFSCTCLDATLHSTICKHVHLVAMKINPDIVLYRNMDFCKKKEYNNDHGDSATYLNKVLASNNNATSAFSIRKTLLLMVEDQFS